MNKSQLDKTLQTVKNYIDGYGPDAAKIQSGVNKILFERYQLGSATNTSAITEDALFGRTLLDVRLIDDFGDFNVGEYYYGRLSTHLYFSQDTTWSTTAYSDDGSSIYLNGELILSMSSCATVNIALKFKKGWNTLVWVLNEQAGNDSTRFGSSIKSVSNLVHMNAYPVFSSVNSGTRVYNSTQSDKLSTSRKIGNANFDGSADITLAQMGVPNIVILTQAEYDALEAAGNDDPNAYYLISDQL